MNNEKNADMTSNDFFGCTEIFDINNIICKKLCCINLRCIIEHNRSMQTEILDELLSSNDALIRIQ